MKEQQTAKIISLTENVSQVKVKQAEQKHVGRRLVPEGHTYYEFNKVNFQLDHATFEDIVPAYVIGGDNTPTKKVIIKPHCYYFSALNDENAVRKMENKFNPEFVLLMTPE